MFCDGEGDCGPCWCMLCKYTGCPACCGCTECHNRSQGYYSPEENKVSHGGYPVTHDWADIP
jgi:hypothetical protein